MMDNLNLDKLIQHKPEVIGLRETHRFAVCIPLIETEHGFDILFEVRSNKINQPGDVCFPGGYVEEDEIPFQTAIRETEEELLINREQLHILGMTDYHYNGRLVIYPYAAILKNYNHTFAKEEVDHVFTVPVDELLNQEPEVYNVDGKVLPPEDFPFDRIVGGKQYHWRSRKESIIFYEAGEHTIWGITAKILQAFLKIVGDNTKNI